MAFFHRLSAQTRIALLLAITLGLGACSSLKLTSKDNVSPPTELKDVAKTEQLVALWRTSVSDDKASIRGQALRPAVRDGAVLIAGVEGDLRSLDAATGETRWKIATEYRFAGGVGMDGRRVVLGTLDGEVVAFDRKDGEQLWQIQLPSEVLATPVVTAATVVVRGNNGRVYGLTSSDGKLAWTFDGDVPLLSLRGNADPVMDGTTIYSAGDNGKLAALDLVEGKLKWEQVLTLPDGRNELERMVDLDGQMRADRGDVFVAGYKGSTTALTSDSGRTLWSQKAESVSGVDVDAALVVVVESDGDVMAMDRRSGGELWVQKDLRFRMLGSPRILGTVVVVGDLEGYLHVISLKDGSIVGRIRHGREAVSAPMVVVDQVLYVQGRGGVVAAYQLRGS